MRWQRGPPRPVLGAYPVRVTCPSCDSLVNTRVEEVTSKKGYLLSALMCAFGCFLCSCLPFFMFSFMNFKHTCPDCNAHIGTFKPSSYVKQLRKK